MKHLLTITAFSLVSALSSTASATVVSTQFLDWSTFFITRDGVNITNTIDYNETYQELIATYENSYTDNYEQNYLAGQVSDNWVDPINLSFDHPDANASVSLSSNAAGATVTATTAYNGSMFGEARRELDFVVPASGLYAIGIDADLHAEANSVNTEITGQYSIFSTTSFRLEYVINGALNNNTDGSFVFTEDEGVDVDNSFGVLDTTYSALIDTTFGGNPVYFNAGDTVTLLFHQDFSLRSSNNTTPVPSPVPLPGGMLLLISGLAGLVRIRRSAA
ncbi:MAG: hypothetical protein V3W04_06705 [Gammaproteobacteria bacterium]